MDTKTLSYKTSDTEVLTPRMVHDLAILPGVSESWIRLHWEELGGVTIGKRKFITKEKMYACIQGCERQMAVEDQRTDKGVNKISDTFIVGDGNNELEHKKRGTESRTNLGGKSQTQILTDHSDNFGFGKFV